MPKIDKTLLQTMDSVMSAGKAGAVFDRMPGAIYGPGMDASASTGLAFLQGELEKLDPRLLEPLTSVTAPRDITMKAGGGWVSNTSNLFVDYSTTASDEDSIIAGETSNIPVSQANISKDVFKVYTFAEVSKIPFFDEAKMQQIGRSLSQIYDDGLRLNFSKILDRNVYVGISKMGTQGLINNSSITSALVANNAGATSRLWINKTPDEILKDINDIITATWAASEYDLTGMATHILIPPSQYGYLVTTKVSTAGNVSILTYLKENNIAKNQGFDLEIFPSRWCIGAGASSTDRMVAYVNKENRVNMDLTVPLSRVMTAPDVMSGSYVTLYAAQLGQVKFLYTQCARYGDGI